MKANKRWGCSSTGRALFYTRTIKVCVAGFLGYPQPGGGVHPPIPSEGGLGKYFGSWADLALGQAHKNSRFRVVRAAGA